MIDIDLRTSTDRKYESVIIEYDSISLDLGLLNRAERIELVADLTRAAADLLANTTE